MISFTTNAWEDYQYWQRTDKKILKKLNELIKDCLRDPYNGLGKPESLKFDLKGYWSRRIDKVHRLVYKFNDGDMIIIACRYHYD